MSNTNGLLRFRGTGPGGALTPAQQDRLLEAAQDARSQAREEGPAPAPKLDPASMAYAILHAAELADGDADTLRDAVMALAGDEGEDEGDIDEAVSSDEFSDVSGQGVGAGRREHLGEAFSAWLADQRVAGVGADGDLTPAQRKRLTEAWKRGRAMGDGRFQWTSDQKGQRPRYQKTEPGSRAKAKTGASASAQKPVANAAKGSPVTSNDKEKPARTARKPRAAKAKADGDAVGVSGKSPEQHIDQRGAPGYDSSSGKQSKGATPMSSQRQDYRSILDEKVTDAGRIDTKDIGGGSVIPTISYTPPDDEPNGKLRGVKFVGGDIVEDPTHGRMVKFHRFANEAAFRRVGVTAKQLTFRITGRPELAKLAGQMRRYRDADRQYREEIRAAEVAVDAGLVDKMNAEATEIAKSIPADHVRVDVERTGSLDGIPSYRYSIDGHEIPWNKLTRHGTAIAHREGAMNAFAIADVVSISRDDLERYKAGVAAAKEKTEVAARAKTDEKARKHREAHERAVATGRRQAMDQVVYSDERPDDESSQTLQTTYVNPDGTVSYDHQPLH